MALRPMKRIPPHVMLNPKLYGIGAVIRNDSASRITNLHSQFTGGL